MQFRFDLCCGWPAVGKSAFGEKCVGVGFVCESSRFFHLSWCSMWWGEFVSEAF